MHEDVLNVNAEDVAYNKLTGHSALCLYRRI